MDIQSFLPALPAAAGTTVVTIDTRRRTHTEAVFGFVLADDPGTGETTYLPLVSADGHDGLTPLRLTNRPRWVTVGIYPPAEEPTNASLRHGHEKAVEKFTEAHWLGFHRNVGHCCSAALQARVEAAEAYLAKECGVLDNINLVKCVHDFMGCDTDEAGWTFEHPADCLACSDDEAVA